MVFGLSKDFCLFLFLSIALAIGSGNWKNGVALLGVYAIVKIVWKLLTK